VSEQRTPLTLPQLLLAYERVLIIKTLAVCGGSCTRAATSLGIRRQRLYDRIHKIGIDLDEVRDGVRRSTPPGAVAGRPR